LFEDNAEFGLGMRVAADRHMAYAHQLLSEMAGWIGEEFVHELINARQHTESEIRQQRDRVAALKQMLVWEPSASVTLGQVQHLLAVADHLVRRSVWIVGGDGWAYDIGSGGLDHVLASGRDVNILVLDTEVYSNTGGQASKSTPLGAVAKFAYGGKSVGKKDLALQAISYGNVYVARIAMGANPQQALLALREAETYPGPSLILAYSHCIAHGIDMKMGLDQQYRAVQSGYWPLLRYNPGVKGTGENPFVLDTVRPVRRFTDFADQELRFLMLKQTNPTAVESLMHDAQEVIDQRWRTYEQLANV
jgi:pyruvate-ferredoxin/flavodoxin oxidoreductase